MKNNRITFRSFMIGIIFCALFAMLTVYFDNWGTGDCTTTQLPVLPYVLLFVTVLLINPLCRLLKVIRPFGTVEILIIFTMGLVSSGVSTVGLSSQLVPFAGALFNNAWNNEQSKWDLYIEPFVSEKFFVSVDGIQTAAQEHRKRFTTAAEAKSLYEAAAGQVKAASDLESARRALLDARNMQAADSLRAMALTRTQSAVETAERISRESASRWNKLRVQGETSSPEVVLRTYPRLIEKYSASAADARALLAELEQKAFDKVALFRRGLPRDLRAFPGFVLTADEDFACYAARVRRLSHGRRSLTRLTDARDELKENNANAHALLQAAATMLDPLAEDAGLKHDRDARTQHLEKLRTRHAAVMDELTRLYDEQRMAPQDETSALAGRITELTREKEELDTRQDEVIERLEGIKSRIEMTGRARATAAGIRALDRDLDSITPDEAGDRLADLVSQYRLFDATLKRFLLGDVPWSHWVTPMLRWGLLIALTYMVFMTFNILIFRQWAHNEKLIYPLAELPEHLAGAGDDGSGRLPPVFRNGLFWLGVGISSAFLGWNVLCRSELLPELKAIDLRNSWSPFISKTALEGLMPYARSEIFFTMIGLSFLIPKKISFSLWFFTVIYMIELLVLVWAGHGVNERSFPAEWWHTINFRFAQGGGALIVFSSVVLFKCRKYILSCVMPASIADLDKDEQRELRIASFLFLAGSTGIVVVLWRGMGANLWYTLFYCGMTLLVTIGMVRAVTEGGILSFQVWAGPFHFIRAIVGMTKAWTSASLFAPLMIYHAVLFLDIKAFIPPAMANALKIRSDLGMKRSRFYAAIFLAIAVAMVVSVGIEIMMCYSSGADEMSGWFFTGFPKSWGLDKVAMLTKNPPAPSLVNTRWIASGALAMSALIYLRQFCFWLPHPIGLIMLVNPLMGAYWFSIMLGWIANCLVTKYGSKDQYTRVRGLFLGLIFGELVIIAATMLITHFFDVSVHMGLNRNM